MSASPCLPQPFVNGVYQAVGMGVGGTVYRTVEPAMKETAEKVDNYLNSFPIQKASVEGKEEVVMSNPEAAVLWSGVGSILLGSNPIGVGLIVTSTAMKVRRMYVNNECSIQ